MPDELDELRQRRMRELMAGQMQDQYQRNIQEQQISSQINTIISQIMEPAAKERLANIRFARPEFARQVEILLIQLYQAGQLPKKLSDEAFKKILEKISSGKREPSIKRI